LVPLIAHIAASTGIQAEGNAKGGRGSGGRSRTTVPAAAAPTGSPVAPSAIVIAPTRELACQIELEAHKLTFDSPLCCTCVYGGIPARQQLQLLAKGVDLLIATPGRLNDFLSRSLITLKNVKFLVLDEADRMLDMGFEPQVRFNLHWFDLLFSIF
jgi:superfamily II DNA/RNA helicase